MRPTEPGRLGDAEIFDNSKALADLGEKNRDLAAGSVECIAGCVEEGWIDSECEQTVRLGLSGTKSKRGDLAGGTPTARPLLAVEDDDQIFGVVDVVCEESLRVRADGLLVEDGSGTDEAAGLKGLTRCFGRSRIGVRGHEQMSFRVRKKVKFLAGFFCGVAGS
jgi:hypothetical protein